MLTISGLKKFYFVPDINDMRCGAHRLLQIVKHKHHLQTDNGDVFIFMSKNQRTVKMVNFLVISFQKKRMSMKRETWKSIIHVVISILTAALTALGTASCMGMLGK